MRNGDIRPISRTEVERRTGEVEEVMRRIFQILPDLEDSANALEDRLNVVLSPNKEGATKNTVSNIHPVPMVQGLSEIYSRLAVLHVALRELHTRIEL